MHPPCSTWAGNTLREPGKRRERAVHSCDEDAYYARILAGLLNWNLCSMKRLLRAAMRLETMQYSDEMSKCSY